MTAPLMLNRAYALHYDKKFTEACAAYRELLLAHPTSHECESARQQLGNLRDFDLVPSGAARGAAAESRAPAPIAIGRTSGERGAMQGEEGRR